MTQPIRWGILGAANFAAEHMAPAIHQAKGAKLVALATSRDEKAAPFRAFCPDIKVVLDYEAMLADPGIDAVYIPLPNHLHVDWTLKALAAGKHVLCEKPIALEAGEIDALIAKRDETGLIAAEAFMITHHPQWQRARDLVRSGAIGRLIHVDGFFSYDNPDAANIRNRPETGGGGIRDIGVYTYGSARFVTGEEPRRIVSTMMGWENGIDTFAHVCAEFESFTYAAATSMRMANRQEMVFHGSDAVLRVPVPFNANVFGQAEIVIERGTERHVERFPGVNHYVLQVENFGRAVRGEGGYPWSLEDARGTQAMIEMVFAAAGAPTG